MKDPTNKKYRVLSIKRKLIIFALCISLIPISIITTIYYVISKNALEKQTLQWLMAVADSRRTHVLEFMDGKRGRTIDFSSDGFIRDSLETIIHGEYQSNVVDDLNKHLKTNKRPLDRHIKEIAVLDIKGTVISSTNETLIGEDMQNRDAFSQTIEKSYGDTYVESPQHISYLNSNCILISAPLTTRNENVTIGVIINYYDLEVLNEITTNRSGMGETGEIYLVNSDKLMLTKSRFIGNAPLNLVVDTEHVNKIIEHGKEVSGIFLDYRGVLIVAATVYIPEYDWILLAEIDKSEAFAHLREFGIFALILGLLCAVVVIIIGVVFANSTSNPIKMLTQATKKFAEGDLDYRIEIKRKDEIGDLGDSFNTMAKELKSLNEKLEERVRDRTEELENKSFELSLVVKRLREEVGERKRAEEQIEASLREKELLIREIYHRTKNNMQVICSLLSLQSKNTKDEKVIAIFRETENRIMSMAIVHAKLYQSNDLSNINLKDYIIDLTRSLFDVYQIKPDQIALKYAADNITVTIDFAVPCGLVINEIITNSLKYAFPNSRKGEIRVSLHSTDKGGIELQIADNGIGVPKDFDYTKTGSLGMQIINNLIEHQLEGKVKLDLENGVGFHIKFKKPEHQERV